VTLATGHRPVLGRLLDQRRRDIVTTPFVATRSDLQARRAR